ncbi:DUF4113 domain-containing protein [Vibrio parahaemolyticus]|nr:DUF4113 domain-containing protein [Vibrio parahaemolyticus]
MDVYDTLNQIFGCVEQGGIAEVQMRRQMLTPQYTTRWVDEPKIRCSLSHTQQIDVRIH